MNLSTSFWPRLFSNPDAHVTEKPAHKTSAGKWSQFVVFSGACDMGLRQKTKAEKKQTLPARTA